MCYRDIRVKLRLYIGERQVMIIQQFESMAKLMSMAFGGEAKANAEKPFEPKNKDEMKMAFSSVFGGM